MKKNKLLIVLLSASLVALVTACGGGDNTGVMAPVVVENTIVPEKTEKPAKEVDFDATYAEYNELEFTKNTEITTKGILYVGNDIDTLEVIDVDWKITNITISEAEDGIQTIVIEQESHGYIGVDDTGNIFATNLNMPVGRLCDTYEGFMIPVGNERETETEIEWRGETYIISATESVTWEDADWKTGWIEAPSGEGEILPSTLKVRTEITVTEGYDGLALVLVPITDADGSVYGKKIMDAWTDGSYLFNVSGLSSRFEDVEEEEEATETEATATPAPIANPTSTEMPAEEEEKPAEATQNPVETTKPAESTPQPTQKPVHVHQYSSKVTMQPNCVNTGTRLYSCECGDSYTESINATGHDYSVPVTQTVHHDEQWDSVARTVYVKKIRCSCGEYFTETATWSEHCVTNIENGLYTCGGGYMVVEEPETIYDYVKISDAYDEEVIVGYECSVCGQQK